MVDDYDPLGRTPRHERTNPREPWGGLVAYTPPPKKPRVPERCVEFMHEGRAVFVPKTDCVWIYSGGGVGEWWLISREAALRHGLRFHLVNPRALAEPAAKRGRTK